MTSSHQRIYPERRADEPGLTADQRTAMKTVSVAEQPLEVITASSSLSSKKISFRVRCAGQLISSH